jgi:phosphocarrier protein FPr
MKQIEIVIQNRTGLHARPAKVLVNLAKQFKSDIRLQHGEKRANAKSMVSVLTLGVISGSGITVRAEGVDEEKAIADIEAAILAGLGDDDGPAEPLPVQVETRVPLEISQPAETHEPGVIKGVGAAPGIAVGPVFHFQQVEFDLDQIDANSSNASLI